MMRILCRLTSLGIVLLLAVPAARAQEQAQDESAAKRARLGLRVSDELRKMKRDRAKEQGSAWTFMGTAAVGQDSNIFDSPGSERDSLFYDFGLKIESLYYFEEHESVKVSLKGTGSLYPESSTMADASQEFKAKYSNRLTDWVRLSLAGMIGHSHDDEVDILGSDFAQDFEHTVYRIKSSARLRLSDRQTLALSYVAKWKDYWDTSDRDSLDWWSHGPTALYRVKIGDSTSLSLSYGFSVRTYDEDLASLVDGTDLASNPEEEHHYHRVAVEGRWRPKRWLELSGRYRFRLKDDRFEDFEAYDEAKWTSGLTLIPFRRVTLRAEGSYAKRDYEHRPGELPGETLEYDEITGSITAHYQVQRNLSLYGRYSFIDRDSNRDTGTSYLDYKVFRFLTGFSFVY